MQIFLFTLCILCSIVLCGLAKELTESDVEKYLCKYGYLTENCNTPEPASTEATKYALKWMQNFANIPMTGVLDAKTKEVMQKRRCACEDVMQKEELMKGSLQPQQFNLGPKWKKTQLTWKVTRFTTKLDETKTLREIIRAFEHWSRVTPLKFVRYGRTADTDLKISFARYDHGDGSYNAFDGKGSVLAHAFFPSNGEVHFDEDEEWMFGDEAGSRGTDFFTVAVHEFGHALGLFHSDVEGALMFPFYQGYNASFQLHTDDIRGIQSLYGSNPGTTTPAPRVLTTMAPRTTTRPPVTRRPATVRPTSRKECQVVFKGAIRDFDGTLFAFTDERYVLKIDDRRGQIDKVRPKNLFERAPRIPDAVYNIPSLGFTYFVRGPRIWQFDRMRSLQTTIMVQGGPRSMPERPRAMITLSGSGNDIYVFGSSILWRMKKTGEVISGSHEYIRSSRRFRGIPNEIDSAVRWDSRTLYFFKGSRFYKYDIGSSRVTSGNIGESFIKGRCGNAPK